MRGSQYIERCDFETREYMESHIGVGNIVLVFDAQRRVYGGTGASGRLVHRGHYRRAEVVGETSRSWVVGHGYGSVKIPKKTLRGIFSNECADAAWFVTHNRAKLHRAVERAIFRPDTPLTRERTEEIANMFNVELEEPNYDGE